MSIVSTVGIDLAKNVFSVPGVDAGDVVITRRTMSRAQFTVPIALLSTSAICEICNLMISR